MIEYLSIDLETKSGTDLSKSGVYRYTEDPEFEILLFGYSVNGGEVSVIDVACGEQIPEDVLRAIVDESGQNGRSMQRLSGFVCRRGCGRTVPICSAATASRRTASATI